MTTPAFVELIRQVIPKEGVKHNGKASRIKAKVKKALTKANIQTETIRGIGQKVGDFAVVYEETGDLLKASFVKADEIVQKKRKSRSKKKANSNFLTGIHPSISHLSVGEFFNRICENLPDEWEQHEQSSYRWLAVDINLLFNTQHTVETAAEYIKQMSIDYLSHVQIVCYTKIVTNDNYVIGIGPI